MRISILVFLLCFSKLIFGQVSFSYSTKYLFYTYNNNEDTIFFSRPIFDGIVTCDIKLIDTININNNGLKEYVFLKTCKGWIGKHGGTFDIVEKLETKTYEVWDLDKKEQLFSASFYYNHQYSRFTAYDIQRNGKGIDAYEYSVAIESDRIKISNLKMNPTQIASDTNDWYNINIIEVDNKVGVYQFDGKGFTKQSDIETIRIIFNEFISNQESTDTDVNKELMTNSLKSITVVKDKNDLDLLINVWMYYDPTDYPDIPEIYRILKDSRPHSIEAVKNRIDNKKEWETDNTAPYSELQNLLKRLENE